MEKHFLIAEDDEEDIDLYKEAILAGALPIKVNFVLYCDGIFKTISVVPLPDLIIVDGNLPGKTLLECITEIRSHETLHRTPLVVLSGSSPKTFQAKSYDAGINLYLEKPNSLNEISELFKRLYYIDWSANPKMSAEEFYALNI
ncbi:MAG: response regulator [Chitinophagaceae bacterium]|nr:response regulator [Chitinophagaceae bacterium]